jgi:hypothetical protein
MAKLADLIDLGLLVDRPSAGIAGRLFQATDDVPATVYRDNGVSWDIWATASTGVSAAEDLTTAELDDTLVLAPDGVGGVEWRAEAGGGGGGGTPATNAAALIYAYLNFR